MRLQCVINKVAGRLRLVNAQLLAWIVAGTTAGFAMGLPDWLADVAETGWVPVLLAAVLPAAIPALIIAALLRLSTDNASTLANRPGRFLALLAFGATISVAASLLLDIATGWGNYSLLLKVSAAKGVHPSTGRYLLSWWCSVMLYGGIFGWAAILYFRRVEEQVRLSNLLVQRSQLARQVAQSRLSEARARIDPGWVARVLSHVQQRYRKDPAAASQVLDSLTDYLRLAMGRRKQDAATPEDEQALLRAYLVLLEAETGVKTAFQTAPDIAAPPEGGFAPAFVLLRQCCEYAARSGAGTAHLQVRLGSKTALTLELDMDPPPPTHSLTGLQAACDPVSAQHLTIASLPLESGKCRYVLHATFF